MEQRTEGSPVFRTAAELRDEQRRHPGGVAGTPSGGEERPAIATTTDLVISPVIGLDQAKRIWNTFLQFRDAILRDPACYDQIEGAREMNRTGATRLAVPFGLSIEERGIEEGRVELADEGDVGLPVPRASPSKQGWSIRGRCRLLSAVRDQREGWQSFPAGNTSH